MDSLGLIEFRYADGKIVAGAYEEFSTRLLSRGDRLEHDDATWVLRDREDRSGVTVYVFTPIEDADSSGEGSQPRARRRGGNAVRQ